MEQRIIELETRLAFQEKAIEELNDALTGQQRQLAAMELQCIRLTALLAKMLPLLEGLEGEA
jgi:SlyX protein